VNISVRSGAIKVYKVGHVAMLIAQVTTTTSGWNVYATGLPQPLSVCEWADIDFQGGSYSVQVAIDGILQTFPRSNPASERTARWVKAYLCK
jgi:hypothetical protein